MPLRDYVAKLAQTRKLWIFQHIPKTAGTSLTRELNKNMAPYRNIHVNYMDRSTSFEQGISNAVNCFIDELRLKENDIRSCSGHLTFDLVSRIQQNHPDSLVVTFLRNPVDRVISDYRYQRSELHPPHEEFRSRFNCIEDYIESPISQNKISNMVYGKKRDPTAETLIEHLGRSFAMVGLVEMYPMSLSSMFAAMGVPGIKPQFHARKTPDTNETRTVITKALRERIAELNQLDMAVYGHVREVLLRHRKNWFEGTPLPDLPAN